MAKLNKSIGGLSNIAFGIWILGIALNKNPIDILFIVLSGAVIITGLIGFFYTNNGKIEKQESKGWAYFYIAFAFCAIGIIIAGIMQKTNLTLITGILWSASILIMFFIGKQLMPK